MNRRGFLFGLGAALIAAPAIAVHATNIMQVKSILLPARKRLLVAEMDPIKKTVQYKYQYNQAYLDSWIDHSRLDVYWDNSGLRPSLPDPDYFDTVDKYWEQSTGEPALAWQQTTPTIIEITNEGSWGNRLTIKRMIRENMIGVN